jgi:hypothetical protein
MEASGQLHAPAALLTEKIPWYPLVGGWLSPQRRSGCGINLKYESGHLLLGYIFSASFLRGIGMDPRGQC